MLFVVSGGSRYGWTAEAEAAGEEEELPPWQIFRVLIFADLARVEPRFFEDMKRHLRDVFGCRLSFRKDRHSDNFSVVPWRSSVRGAHGHAAFEVFVEGLLAAFPDVVQEDDLIDFLAPQSHSSLQVLPSLTGWQAVWRAPDSVPVAEFAYSCLVPPAEPGRVIRGMCGTTARCQHKEPTLKQYNNITIYIIIHI